MILINPPVAKSCEPPPGLARLCGALRYHGVDVLAIDMNLEAFEYLYDQQTTPGTLWEKRAVSKKGMNLDLLRSFKGYDNLDRYKNAVLDITKTLGMASRGSDTLVSLANFKHDRLSPVKSLDLLFAAEHPDENVFYPYFEKRFRILSKEGPGLQTVGFSLNYLNQALTTFAMIGHIKHVYPKTRIILGGGLVTSWMRKPDWVNPFSGLVDDMVAGEGEGPLLAMYGVDQKQTHVLPDYSDFPQSSYLAPDLILPYCASSGCYWRKCTFCPEQAEHNPYRPIPAGTVMNHLFELCDRYDPCLIHIVDNAVSPSLLKTLGGSNFKTPWYAFARMTPHLADPGLGRALKRSGCAMLQLGLESGDSGVLDEMAKGLDLGLASRVLHNLHKAGIATYVYILFGTPSENEVSAGKTMDFVVDHSEMIGFLNIALFNLPYFAEQSETLETSQFYDGDLSLYREFNHPLGWNRAPIRHFLKNEFKKHPKIADIVKGDPPVFNSNHAPFFT